MLKKRLTSSSDVFRSGVALARSRAARRRSSVNGRATRTNGRIWSRRTGVVSSRNGVTAAFVAGSSRIGSRSDCSVVRSSGAKSRTSLERALGGAQRAGQPRHRRRDVLLLARERAEDRARGADEAAQVVGTPADLGHQQAVAVDEPLERHAPARRRARDPRQVAVHRLEAAEDLAQVRAAPAQALAGAGDEQLQVRPRVGVESGVDLVWIDVGKRVGNRDAPAVLDHAARCPG